MRDAYIEARDTVRELRRASAETWYEKDRRCARAWKGFRAAFDRTRGRFPD